MGTATNEKLVNRKSAPPADATPAAADSAAALDYGFLPQLIGYHLRRAQLYLFSDFSRAVAHLQTTSGQYAVLTLIGRNPGLTQSALARAVDVERSTMVAVIDSLQHRGLVERRASPVDRRSYALVLTAAGERLLAEVEAEVRRHDRRMGERLSEPERATLIDLLRRVGPAR